MRDKRSSFERRTFWPRSSRPDLLGEVDFDRPCPNCGYNLRGLEPGRPCPECGSVRGLNIYEEPLPWELRRSVGSYLIMLIRVMFTPHALARHVWAPMGIDLEAAQRLRRLGLVIAAPALCGVAYALTAWHIGAARAGWCMIFDLPAIIVWLNAASLEPVVFFRDKLSGHLLKRAEAMAHYATAVLALVPATQLALLLVTQFSVIQSDSGWLIAAALHVGLLMFTLACGLSFIAWLMHETVNISAAGAFAYTLGAATSVLGSAAVLLIGVPTLVGAIAGGTGG